MRLTDASVVIRPRTSWEAIDLGVLLAHRHAGLLMASWALVSLPLLALLSAALWEYPTLVGLLFWWLKPLWEPLPLYILSRALFSDTPTLATALRAYPRLLRPHLLASLSWRRLSPTRSFELPVRQLEGLSGSACTQRLALLKRRSSGVAGGLTLLGCHIELLLLFGLAALLWLMVPQQMESHWNWERLVSAGSGDWLWLEHLSNLLYALVLMFWGPIYVACGFTLYLNRRTELEAWDIELSFRRLRQRLSGSAYAVLLAAGLLLCLPASDSLANSSPADTAPIAGPQQPRLLLQPLTSAQSRESIEQILEAAPFHNYEEVTRWRWGDESKPAETDDQPPAWLRWLLESSALSDTFDGLAGLLKVLLWALAIIALVLVLWRYREWLATFAARLQPGTARRPEAPAQLFGLALNPHSLPDDIASEAQRLWAEQPRAALCLLYRALLSRLLHEHQLPLKSAHTEGEVLQLVAQLHNASLSGYSQLLTRHWQALAYGQQLPPEALQSQLCDGWRQLFDRRSPA